MSSNSTANSRLLIIGRWLSGLIKGPALIKLRRVLEEVMEARGQKKILNEALVFLGWPQAVGKQIAVHAEPQALRGKVLHVHTESPVWAQELAALESQLVSKVNATVGREVVTEIRFRGRGGLKQKSPDPPERRVFELGQEDFEAVEAAMAPLPDGPLKEGLRRVIVGDRRRKKSDKHHDKAGIGRSKRE